MRSLVSHQVIYKERLYSESFLKLTVKIIIIGTTDWAKFAHEWRMGYVVNTFVLLVPRIYQLEHLLNMFSLFHTGDV